MKNNSKEKDDRLNPNNKICNPPTYKIHGSERRELKKKVSGLKYFVKHFWHQHKEDKDMASVYGGSDTFPMSDDKAKILYDLKVKELDKLESLLTIPYLQVFREERLKQLLDEV